MSVGRHHRLHEGVPSALVLAAALWLGACGGQSDPERERQTLASWGAAVGMASEQWSNGAVPGHFLHDLLQSAQNAFEEERQATLQITSRAARAELLAALDSLQHDAAVLQQQLARGDTGSARHEAALVSRIAVGLGESSQKTGAQ